MNLTFFNDSPQFLDHSPQFLDHSPKFHDHSPQFLDESPHHSLLDEVHGVEGLLLLAPELGHKVDPDHLRESLGDRRLLVFGPESQWQAARMSYGVGDDRGARSLSGNQGHSDWPS